MGKNPYIGKPADDEEEMEQYIVQAESCGIFMDRRDLMPQGSGRWPTHPITDVLGCCIHQSGSSNMTDPIKTAKYHTSTSNHITPGRAMPSICYDFVIADADGPAWLVANPLDRKYEQGSSKHPGDENRHLLSILVMGSFSAPGYAGYRPGPTLRQLRCLEVLVHWCKDVFAFDDNALMAHSDFGKSTCLTGDTKVPLLNGTEATLESLHRTGKPHWFYSCDEKGQIVAGGPSFVQKTGIKRETVRISLDNGKDITCTPDHLFLTTESGYLPAGDLTPGMSLMPFRRRVNSRGYEEVFTKKKGPITDVYDVVNCQPQHNFGLSAGVFVHNCPGSALVEWIETRRVDAQQLETAEDWQAALLQWDPDCLPKYGVDGDWGDESKFALSKFQRWAGIKPTAFQDVFTELMLLRIVNNQE